MGTERRVEMLRLERPEEVYDREEVLGRDASSVFPSKAKEAAVAAAKAGQLDADAIREMLGARKFVTETELEKIKASRGTSVDDGTATESLKPLVEVLREAKEKKEADFQAMWKQMKTGKNRPLDEDELKFLDEVAQAEAAKLRAQKEEELAELEAFRLAAEQAAAEAAGGGAEAGAGAAPVVGPAPGPTKKSTPKPTLPVKPVIKAVIKPKAPATTGSKGPSAGQQQQQQQQQDGGPAGSTSGRDIDQPVQKRQKVEQGAAAAAAAAAEDSDGQEGGGLGALLGGYGSDDDDG